MRVLIVSEGRHEQGGALETLVRRLLPAPELACETRRVSDHQVHTHRGKGQGFFKRAVRWMLHAQKHGFEAIVLLIDEDDRRESRAEIDEAQDNAIAKIRRALGIAIRSFDAWMLADEQALGRALGATIHRQRDPETISAPKQVCADLLALGITPCTQTEMYARIAAHADLALLVQRCPAGFAPFATRVRRLQTD